MFSILMDLNCQIFMKNYVSIREKVVFTLRATSDFEAFENVTD